MEIQQEGSIAIFDANNFYVSCQRAFEPKLKNKPVVVLSNNDGCAISRSNEAKALGIAMGAPYFKFKDFAKEHGIFVYSSNYALYADMSNRFMSILGEYSPDQEVYSIDECFLDFTTFKHVNHTALSKTIRSRILRAIGLPICGGLSTTKTLAKLANHCAKSRPHFEGVCNFNDMTSYELKVLLSEVEVKEIWGVGRKLAPKLNELGFYSVYDLKQANPETLRNKFSVVMEKTIRELNGVMCIKLEDVIPPKQQIMSSRSFGVPVFDIEGLAESISLYVSRAAEKLRKQKSYAGSIFVFIRTSPFIPKPEQYSEGIRIPIPTQTNDTCELVNIALWGLRKIYQPGFKYAKAGIMLGDLVSISTEIQTDLFSNQHSNTIQSNVKKQRLMNAMDTVNNRMGKGTLIVGSQGFKRPWQMKQDFKSNSYTTNIDEILLVN